MKKWLYAVLAAVFILQSAVLAANEDKNSLKFESAGGGKFIYCNNREELSGSDMADNAEAPVYIMSNRGLTPDKYRLYVTHFNRAPKSVGDAEYAGADMWIDAVFTAKTDCVIDVIRTGFEVPANNTSYLNYEPILTEYSWSALYACADIMNKPIKMLGSDRVFEPTHQKKTKISIKKGERVFLSEYIPNYTAVPYPKHVMMIADFKIKSGSADLDIFAAKKRVVDNGKATYPDVDFDTCGFGSYKRDRTIKGIADSLPEKSVKLEYTIGDEMHDGTYLPVKIYNQYYPKGNSVLAWVTNLNPQGDGYSRHLNAEDSIMTFRYKDEAKLGLYGKNVSDEHRDDVWIFDTHHSDSAEFSEKTGFKKEEYIPNYYIEGNVDDPEFCCNLGNYGVTLRYDLTVKNTGEKDRYFDYTVTTAANVIVELTDDKGTDMQPVLAKGQKAEATEETMASVKLPAGETTKFSIGITLPVQNFGGQRQAFMINSKKAERQKDKNTLITPVLEKKDTGITELPEKADEKTRAVFEGNINDFHVVKTDFGYAAYNAASEGGAYNYWYYWDKTGKVFLLDDKFCIIKEIYFGSQPIEMRCFGGKVYVKTIASGSFCIDEKLEYEPFDSYILPQSIENGAALWAADGKLKAAAPDGKFYDIAFQKFTPPFAENNGELFYYAAGERFGVSRDGIYWENKVLDEKIEGIRTGADHAEANGEIARCPKEAPKIRLNDEFLSFDTLPEVRNGRILVPVRFILEKLGMRVIFDDVKGRIIAVSKSGFIELIPGSDTAKVNGSEVALEASPEIIDGRTFVPLRFLSEKAGLEVDWDGENKIAVILGKTAETVGELELEGDISALFAEDTDEKADTESEKALTEDDAEGFSERKDEIKNDTNK